jgi:hypothetical protein
VTGLLIPAPTWSPEPPRPEPLDGPRPDVFTDFDTQFVVEWQVVDSWQLAGPGPAV